MKHITYNIKKATVNSKQRTDNKSKELLSGNCYLITDQSGQTMIETLVAIFILITALVGGLTVMIFALNSAKVSQNQIIATNLAREGVEVVRMMRDSNWLKEESELAACADLANKYCYPRVYGYGTQAGSDSAGIYHLKNGGAFSAHSKNLRFDVAPDKWKLLGGPDRRLFLNLANGRYSPNSAGSDGNSQFARMINFTWNTAAPYTLLNPQLIVRSVVTWQGKGCNTDVDGNLLTISTKCRVIVEEQLTNWKDYK